jgi:hypothetical protein
MTLPSVKPSQHYREKSIAGRALRSSPCRLVVFIHLSSLAPSPSRARSPSGSRLEEPPAAAARAVGRSLVDEARERSRPAGRKRGGSALADGRGGLRQRGGRGCGGGGDVPGDAQRVRPDADQQLPPLVRTRDLPLRRRR